MILTYSGKSAPSAQAIADQDEEIYTVRGGSGDINWGRAWANTKLNPDISKTTNKREMRQLFKEQGVPMPALVSWSDVSSDLSRGIYRKVVGRPDRHTRGRGFWLCHNPADVTRALQGTRKKRGATHFMEYINAPHELRVHIFKGKSIRISEKLMDSTGVTAHGNYTTIKPTCPVKQARKAAKQAVEALGLDFGCVDILVEDDGTPYVLECNAAPGLGGTLPKLYAETFKRWYEEAPM